jgi:hypothetical protein
MLKRLKARSPSFDHVNDCRVTRDSSDGTRGMTAMQAKLGSKRAVSRSTSGRARRDVGVSRVPPRMTAGAAPDEATKALIHRRWRCGFSIEVLAEQFGLGRSRTERIINEVRARRLLEARLEYVSDPGFEDPAAIAEILYKFKVAGLRNVAMTPPYFHDGSVASLPEAVRIMARVQLDTDLSQAEVEAIVAFLGALTGTQPEAFERAPVLPAAGFDAPSAVSGDGSARW